HFTQAAIKAVDFIAHPELDVRHDLVVAAACRMELAADIAEAFDQCPFDMGVDVFKLDRKGKLAAFDLAGNRAQRCDDLGRLLSGQETDVREHAGVRLAGAQVLTVKPAARRLFCSCTTFLITDSSSFTAEVRSCSISR